MPRFYVKRDQFPEWQIFSTETDNYVLDDWVSFGHLMDKVLDEQIEATVKDMTSLLTSKPKVNTMTEAEADRLIKEAAEDGYEIKAY